MRETPYFAIFKNINVLKMEKPRLVHVIVSDSSKGRWAVPDGTDANNVWELPGHAGTGGIFFFQLERGVCENCFVRDPFDIYVDVTQALRSNRIRPKHVVLHCLVEDEDGELLPIEETPVPEPIFRGPKFKTLAELEAADEGDVVEELQKELIGLGLKESDVVDGQMGEKTAAAVLRYQRAAGLKEDGVVGPVTQRALARSGLQHDASTSGLPVAAGDTVKYWFNTRTLPGSLPKARAEAELRMAFASWSDPTGIHFVQCTDADEAHVKIGFANLTVNSDAVFDGPGGALAKATASSISFDKSERWELQGIPHKDREWVPWEDSYFGFLPVAIHEIGHVLGLDHSSDPADVMSPYYFPDCTELTDNDVARVKALISGRAPMTASSGLDNSKSAYIAGQKAELEPALSQMLNNLATVQPANPFTFMAKWMSDHAAERGEHSRG